MKQEIEIEIENSEIYVAHRKRSPLIYGHSINAL